MKINKIFLSVAMLAICIFVGASINGVSQSSKLAQEVRTATYDEKSLNDEGLFDDFEKHEVTKNYESITVKAEKQFDKSIFSEFDLVSFDADSESITVNYQAVFVEEESTMYLSVSISNNEGEEPIIEVLPGLVTFNKNGDTDVMFMDGEEEIWLSDLAQSDVINNTGFWSFIRKVINYAVESEPVKEIVNVITAICAPFIRIAVTTLYLSGHGSFAAWIGAQILNMKQEYKVTKYSNGTEVSIPTGIYHANFNCWQKNVGYDDFYDEVFDNGTQIAGRKRMARHKYEIDMDGNTYNGPEYILWAWKGDYYNLGAGCELGIYKKIETSNFGLRWTVDTSKAFSCNAKLYFSGAGKNIIDWNNNGNKHWWFTGFNSNYQFPVLLDINQLTATFEVTFNSFSNPEDNETFYNDFYHSYIKYRNQSSEDWKYWSTNKANILYYNGMRCHKATLSF